jgi:8-oxo-dGTP diphosphatase
MLTDDKQKEIIGKITSAKSEDNQIMKIEIFGNDEFDNSKLKYAIIFSKYLNKWIYVKHRERSGWVVPSGHREDNESIFDTAKRELYEETGAKKYAIEPLFYYSVELNEIKNYGKVFYARVEELDDLPESEIERIELFDEQPSDLTFPVIHQALEKEVIKLISKLE